MIGISMMLTVGLITGIGLGALLKNRTLRIIAWCISALCAAGLLSFYYAITHLLQR